MNWIILSMNQFRHFKIRRSEAIRIDTIQSTYESNQGFSRWILTSFKTILAKVWIESLNPIWRLNQIKEHWYESNRQNTREEKENESIKKDLKSFLIKSIWYDSYHTWNESFYHDQQGKIPEGTNELIHEAWKRVLTKLDT